MTKITEQICLFTENPNQIDRDAINRLAKQTWQTPDNQSQPSWNTNQNS